NVHGHVVLEPDLCTAGVGASIASDIIKYVTGSKLAKEEGKFAPDRFGFAKKLVTFIEVLLGHVQQFTRARHDARDHPVAAAVNPAVNEGRPVPGSGMNQLAESSK